MTKTDWRRPCCFCGNLLSWSDTDELPDHTVRCQDKLTCRDCCVQRIADLKALVAKQRTAIETLQDVNRAVRVEALREVESRVRAMPISEETRRTFPTAECDMNAMRILIIALIDRLIAREQPAPPESGDDS